MNELYGLDRPKCLFEGRPGLLVRWGVTLSRLVPLFGIVASGDTSTKWGLWSDPCRRLCEKEHSSSYDKLFRGAKMLRISGGNRLTMEELRLLV